MLSGRGRWPRVRGRGRAVRVGCVLAAAGCVAALTGSTVVRAETARQNVSAAGVGQAMVGARVSTLVASGAGDALSFNGATDGTAPYVSVPDAASLDNTLDGSFTLEAWVKWDGGSGYRVVVSKPTIDDNTNVVTGVALVVSDGEPCLALSTSGGNRVLCATASPLTSGAWAHLAASYDGQTSTVYENGAIAATQDWGNSAFPSVGSSPLLIGREFANGLYDRSFGGTVDDVRLWNAVLSQATIASWRYQAVTAAHPNYGNLVSSWQFDEGSGTTTADSGPNGNANTGTLVNSPAWVVSDAPIGDPSVPTDTPTATPTDTPTATATPVIQTNAYTDTPDANGQLIYTEGIPPVLPPPFGEGIGNPAVVYYSMSPDMSNAHIVPTCLDGHGGFMPCNIPRSFGWSTFQIDGAALARQLIPACATSTRCRGTVYFQGTVNGSSVPCASVNAGCSPIEAHTYDSMGLSGLTPTDTPTATPTDTATNTPTETPTDTPAATATNTPATATPALPTATAAPQATSTTLPTSTPAGKPGQQGHGPDAAPTATLVPATATPVDPGNIAPPAVSASPMAAITITAPQQPSSPIQWSQSAPVHFNAGMAMHAGVPAALDVHLVTTPHAPVTLSAVLTWPHLAVIRHDGHTVYGGVTSTLYHTTVHATADGRGEVSRTLRLAYRPGRTVRGMLTLTITTPQGTATRSVTLVLAGRHQPTAHTRH